MVKPSVKTLEKDAESETSSRITLRQEDIHQNPKFLKLVPRPSHAEFEILKKSMLRNGQEHPIIVNAKGEVLDGNSRYRATKELGIGVKFIVREFANEKEEKKFVIRSAVERRNLAAFQKVKLAQGRLREERIVAKKRQKAGTFVSRETKVGDALAIVAKEFGLSRATLAKGSYILKHATRQQCRQLDAGLSTINGLYHELKASRKSSDKGKMKDGSSSNPVDQKAAISEEPATDQEPDSSTEEQKEDLNRRTTKNPGELIRECANCGTKFEVTKMNEICAKCLRILAKMRGRKIESRQQRKT